MLCRNMSPNMVFWYRNEWYIKKDDFRVDGELYNCVTMSMNEPDWALLDEKYSVCMERTNRLKEAIA